ncbi:MAG: carbohydrate kinase family protein [Candidatus Bathycorpusculaceae bacterium]
MFDVVSVGHLCIDHILLPNCNAPFVTLGGSAAYVSFVARRLSAKAAVISKVGGKFPTDFFRRLKNEGADLSWIVRVAGAGTTSFELKYSRDLSSRVLRLRSRAPNITVADLPSSLKAKTIHIAPIAGEISFDVVEKLRNCADVLSLDPQGLVRNFDDKGDVTHGPLKEERILELIDVYKSSSAEIEAVTKTSNIKLAIKKIHDFGIKTVIVTLGMKGALMSAEESLHQVPAYKPEKIADPTGAGDAFIGGFLAELAKGKDRLWCACVGSTVASLVIEVLGPTFFGDKRQIYERAKALYGKEIKE